MHIPSAKHRQRRQFLKRCAATALLGSGAGAVNGKLGLIGSALAACGDYSTLSDYKALVCVFLYGGSDSFSMFVPTDQGAYDTYAASRGNLSVDRDDLLTTADSPIGFHPLLADLHNLYTDDRLNVVSNVGNLIQPIMSRLEFINSEKPIPNDLFAHNHQQEQWLKGLSSSPASIVGSGWGGRMADLLHCANSGASLPPSFSLAGSNYWLPGADIQPVGLNPLSGLSLLTYLDDATGASNLSREATLDQILAGSSSHLLKQQVAASLGGAKSGASELAATLAANPAANFTTDYTDTSRLAQQLRMVARLIAGQSALGMNRQIFFVGVGGWDTHDNQTPRLNALLSDLNQSLSEFQGHIDSLGVANSVTTFTASDFGRTLTINGDGSDHGWGGHYLTMGGAVNGGQLFGTLPSFAIGADDDSGDKGRIIPSISINQYGAALARWMGLSDNDINLIFPDLDWFGDGWKTDLTIAS